MSQGENERRKLEKMGDSEMSDVKKLIWDIDKQMRVGAKYYNMFATATQKYTYLMMQLKALDEQKYDQYKEEMTKRFEGVINEQAGEISPANEQNPEYQLSDINNPGTLSEQLDAITNGDEARPGESASEPDTQLSLNLDSASASDGSGEVRESQLASGNEVEPGS